jgi:hypothetical protein
MNIHNSEEVLLQGVRAKALEPSSKRTRNGRLEVVHLPSVASADLVFDTEEVLGFRFHPLLKRLYLEIANGGFGPGYGLIRLGGPNDVDKEPAALPSSYVSFRTGNWPDRLLPLWDWGCTIWSCIDLSSADGVLVTHDDMGGPTITEYNLHSWLSSWVSGVDLWHEIYEEKEVILTHPFTKTKSIVKMPDKAKGIRPKR